MENNILKRTLKVSTVTSEPMKTGIKTSPISGKNPLIDFDVIENNNFFEEKIEEYVSEGLSKNNELS